TGRLRRGRFRRDHRRPCLAGRARTRARVRAAGAPRGHGGLGDRLRRATLPACPRGRGLSRSSRALMPPPTLNVALVGLGYWGRNLLRIFGATPGARVTTACDRDEALLAELEPSPAAVRRAGADAEVLTAAG